MCDEWMPTIILPLTLEQFRQLPRNPAYRYEFLGGQAYLSPRPKHYHALLDLRPMVVPDGLNLHLIQPDDVGPLESLFSGVFVHTQPYGCLDATARREGARQALERTRTGGDGPWIQQASFVAREGDRHIGAIFITLLPEGDPSDWGSYHWSEPPPADCIDRRLGRPHLTWVFVSRWQAGQGVGTALLGKAVNALLDLGFTQMLSTFMIGNDSSMLWHWRNGFRLLAFPGSLRRLHQQV